MGVDSIAYHSQVLEGLPWTKESRASFILINASASGERLGRDSLRCALKVVRACKYESTFVWVHLTKHALRHRVETNHGFLSAHLWNLPLVQVFSRLFLRRIRTVTISNSIPLHCVIDKTLKLPS